MSNWLQTGLNLALSLGPFRINSAGFSSCFPLIFIFIFFLLLLSYKNRRGLRILFVFTEKFHNMLVLVKW